MAVSGNDDARPRPLGPDPHSNTNHDPVQPSGPDGGDRCLHWSCSRQLIWRAGSAEGPGGWCGGLRVDFGDDGEDPDATPSCSDLGDEGCGSPDLVMPWSFPRYGVAVGVGASGQALAGGHRLDHGIA